METLWGRPMRANFALMLKNWHGNSATRCQQRNDNGGICRARKQQQTISGLYAEGQAGELGVSILRDISYRRGMRAADKRNERGVIGALIR